jgi:hypothetical protein
MAEKFYIRVGQNNGNITLKPEGVTGSGCQELTANLERKLGVVTDDKLTDEYYQEENAVAQQIQNRN